MLSDQARIVRGSPPSPQTRATDRGVEPFRQDVRRGGRYRYAGGERLSARLANGTISAASFEVASFEGRRVLDIGCGDGTYTLELVTRCRPSAAVALDPAAEAIEAARSQDRHGLVDWRVGDAYSLPYEAGEFQLAYLRGVLHHLEDPALALAEALRVAEQIVVVEPNGYSPALKVIERASRYHREHGERSFVPRRLDRWIEGAGGMIGRRIWRGLVPMFAPDAVARLAKRVEPAVESVPGLRALACAVYVVEARSRARGGHR